MKKLLALALTCCIPAGARDCVSVNRAVLTGHVQRVSVRDRARHM